MQSLRSKAALLNGSAAAIWLLLAGPAYLVAGYDGLWGLSIASLLCLVPGWVVCWLSSQVLAEQSPLVLPALGGLLRMVFVFGGLFAVQAVQPRLGFRGFVVWLLACYLAVLAVETWVVVRQFSGREAACGQAGDPLEKAS